jgi:hypothetical protein
LFVLFLVLAGLSLILLVIGSIWMLSDQGQTTRRSGRDVGAEIMGGLGNDDPVEEGIPLVEKSVFVGKGVEVTREAGISFTEIKQLVRERQWRAALPPLLGIVGMFGLIIFGVLALWWKMDDKLIATLIAAIALSAMARIGWSFIRA